ncbi:MAG: hypothetical protein JWN76_1849 [Chitinophagaceae bacterium]|nr:hypothetical protein [Chitinophagaceae bacterium]
MNAVITADIIGSTKLSVSTDRNLKRNLEKVLTGTQYEFYRGDSMQIYIEDAAFAFPLLLKLRTACMRTEYPDADSPIDLRAGIGIGEAAVKKNGRVTNGTGRAFVLSGRGFDTLQGPIRTFIECDDAKTKLSMGLLSTFTDHLFSSLTQKQAEVLFELLEGKTQTAVARKLKKSQPTIHQFATAANWNMIRLLPEYFDQMINRG